MRCAHCTLEIDDDSFFCDQCGEEVRVCPTCLKPGRHKRCPDHGSLLVNAKNYGPSPVKPFDGAPSAAPAHTSCGGASQLASGHARSGTSVVPGIVADSGHGKEPKGNEELRLVNGTLGLDLAIVDGAVIGRSSGDYVNVFGAHGAVSSRHCAFRYEQGRGWVVIDLGSSNGTSLNGTRLAPGQAELLPDKSFLTIANLEFYVKVGSAAVSPAPTPTGTIRI